MTATAVLQVSPATGTPLAYLGTFLLFAVGYSATAHIAARNVLGDVPLKRALLVGPMPAAVSLLLQQYGVVAILFTIIVDFVAIRYVYRLRLRTTALVTLIHIVVTVLVRIVVLNAYRLVVLGPLA